MIQKRADMIPNSSPDSRAMSPKTTLLPPKLKSYLAARALRQADALYAEGKPEKAVRLYARAGAFHHAARLAIETADERRAVECSLKAALGHVPENYAGASALEAGALLAESGHHGLALGLFELAGANRQAAELAAGQERWSRAARLYERAHLYAEAAACYDKAGQKDAALRMLEQQSRQLRRTSRVLSPKETKQLQSIEIHRAEILDRLGRTAEAVELLLTLPPSVAVIDLLEQTGRTKEALEACLKNGDGERAARLLRDHPELDRAVVARAYLGFGRPIEAGNLLASLGLAREAAQAYEAGRDWPRAGSRWEAAQEYERAIEAYQRAGRTQDAARCLSAAGRPLEAAAYAAMAGDPATAAGYYLKGGRPMRAAVSLLAAGDRAGAARLLLLLTPGDKDFLEATRAVI